MNESPETRLSLIGRLHDKRDGEAWDEFVQTYQPLILSIARKRGLQHADAAEITQDVLNRVAQSIERWNPDPQKGSFRAWLYRVTRNLTIDHLRRTRNLPKPSTDEIDQVPVPSNDESREFRLEYERQLFHWAASRTKPSFKPQNWNAFWMSAVKRIPIDSVAQELSMSRGQVYVARSRVMAKISAVIRQRLDETSEV